MTCVECKSPLSYLDHRKSMDKFQAELCPAHLKRMEKFLAQNDIPEETIILYYALKEKGIKPMLAWWDGKRTVDLAISRVKLNIEIEKSLEPLTSEKALQELEKTMHSYKNGFTTIRIPYTLIRKDLGRTVENIQGIMDGLRVNIKVI